MRPTNLIVSVFLIAWLAPLAFSQEQRKQTREPEILPVAPAQKFQAPPPKLLDDKNTQPPQHMGTLYIVPSGCCYQQACASCGHGRERQRMRSRVVIRSRGCRGGGGCCH